MKRIFLLIILCGCIGQQEFTLTDITFCAGEPFERSYQQKHDAYMQGEIVWLYCEAFKFDYKEDHPYVASFHTVLNVYDAEGTFIGEVAQNIEVPFQESPVYVWFKFWIDSSDLEEGVYTVQLTITDTVSRQSATAEGTFSITVSN